MADKTINQLTALDALATGDELAVYDASASTTKKTTAAQVKAFATSVDINGLSSASPATGDSVAIYDASASANRKATISDILALGGGGGTMDIDGLAGATPATGDSVPIYDASASGNRKTTLMDVKGLMTDVDIDGLTSASPANGDYVPIYDVSASANRKALVSDLVALGGGGGGGMDIVGLASASPDGGDNIAIYDASASGNRKTTLLDLAALTHSVANNAIDALASDDRLVFRDTSTGQGRYATVAALDERWGLATGSWTPTISFGGASVGVTYGAATGGVYAKIGSLVMVSFRLVLTSKGSSTGDALIGGLPFPIGTTSPASSNMRYYAAGWLANAGTSPGGGLVLGGVAGNSTIVLGADPGNGSQTTITNAHIANNTDIRGQLWYLA